MLETDKLKQLVMEIIPEPYKPPLPLPPGVYRDKDAPMPTLTHVAYQSKEEMGKMLQRYSPDTNHDNVRAICVNWGILSRDAGSADWKSRLNSFYISLRDDLDISVLGLSFIILHEVGHIHWKCCPEKRLSWKLDNEELFADMYAHDRLAELYGTNTAIKLMSEFGSAHGFQAFVKEGEKCPT